MKQSSQVYIGHVTMREYLDWVYANPYFYYLLKIIIPEFPESREVCVLEIQTIILTDIVDCFWGLSSFYWENTGEGFDIYL